LPGNGFVGFIIVRLMVGIEAGLSGQNQSRIIANPALGSKCWWYLILVGALKSLFWYILQKFGVFELWLTGEDSIFHGCTLKE
jgi:hypothetical protein